MKTQAAISVLPILLALTIVSGCRSGETQSASEKQEKVMGLISIGMNIDEARDILLKQGFKVSRKHFPTKRKDYCQVLIPLISRIPASETARYVTGSEPGKTKAYVIVTAKPDGTITEIE